MARCRSLVQALTPRAVDGKGARAAHQEDVGHPGRHLFGSQHVVQGGQRLNAVAGWGRCRKQSARARASNHQPRPPVSQAQPGPSVSRPITAAHGRVASRPGCVKGGGDGPSRIVDRAKDAAELALVRSLLACRCCLCSVCGCGSDCGCCSDCGRCSDCGWCVVLGAPGRMSTRMQRQAQRAMLFR